MSVIVADWKLIYREVDISSELDPMTTSVTYTDKLHGEADEIEVTVQDKDGLWRGAWCPETGDIMELWISRGGAWIYAGRFEMDEPQTEIGRGGDTMTMRGVAAPVTKALRTEKTVEYEDKSVEDIAGEIAGRNELSLTGSFNTTRWRRKTQRRMRDLEFLVQMGEDTDHYVSVRGDEVQMHKVDDIDGAAPAIIVSVNHPDFISFSGKIKTSDTYSSAKASHLHDEEKRLVEAEETDTRVKTGDTLRLVERVEDEAQAQLMAKSHLHQKNRHRRSGTLTLSARPDLVAGSVVELDATFGKWAGRYVANSSAHTQSRAPYPTKLDLKEARS